MKRLSASDLDRRLLVFEDDAIGSVSAMQAMRAKRNFEYWACNARWAVEAYLRQMSIFVRAKHDIARAKQLLRDASAVAPQVGAAARDASLAGAGEDNWIYSLNFSWPLIASLLDHQWAAAEALAAALPLAAVREEEGNAGDIEAKLYGAVIRSDRTGFDKEMARFKAGISKRDIYDLYFIGGHDRLLNALLDDDQRNFELGLEACEGKFLSRSKDRREGMDDLLESGAAVFDATFDLRAVALSNLAARRGLRITYRSDLIPNDLFGTQ